MERLVSVFIVSVTLALIVWAVGIMVRGLILAVQLLRRPLRNGEAARAAPAFRRIAAALLVALAVILVGTVVATAILVTERESRLVRLRAAFAQVESDVNGGLSALRGRLAGLR
jgi:hypothetical protein